MTIPVLKIKVTPKPVVKGKMDVRFPANVATAEFLTVTKSNGTYTFGVDYTLLDPINPSNSAATFLVIYDGATTSYRQVSLTALFALAPTTSQLVVASGKVLTVNHSLTLDGTDGTTQTFPSTSGTVVTSVSSHAVTNAMAAQVAAYTLKGNATNATADQADISIPALTAKASPTGSDLILIADAAASNALKKATISSIAVSAPIYATRALAIAANLASYSSVRIDGYTAAGDGGGGLYKKLGGTPSPVKAWHFQSSDGAYWQLTENIVRPEHFGALGDNSTDDATAIGNWVSYILTIGAEGRLSAKFYKTSGSITIPDGTDPGGFKIIGCGFDLCGFTYTGTSDFIYGPATSSNRHTGVMLQDFLIVGSNTGNCGINVLNALDCTYSRLHIKGFTNDAIRFDGTVSYGALRCTVEQCKTSPTTSNASLQSGNPAAINVILSNYLTIRENYFSGFIDVTPHQLVNLIKNAGDSTACYSNIYETATNAVTTSGGSFCSLHDHPVGSTIVSKHFVVTANAATTIFVPRGTTSSVIDTSAVTAPGNLTIILEDAGLLRNFKQQTSVVSTLDVAGLDYVDLNFTGTITAFANVVKGKLYTLYSRGTAPLARSNAVYSLTGADLSPTNGQAAIFVGESTTQLRQLTSFAAAT
jgi:hypothetical protein